MTLSADDKKTLSDVRFAKAREALADAHATLAQKRLNNAVNRSYYAAQLRTCATSRRASVPPPPWSG